jgi:hypothetical protein
MHFWSMPVKPRLFIHCAQCVSGFLKTLLLWTKYAAISPYCSHSIQSGLVFFVARRGETCRRMSTLQSEIQIAIRPRPTLARLVCSSQLSRLRRRSCRYKFARYGEDLHDLIGLRAQMNPAAHRQCPSESALLWHAFERERLGHALSHFAQPSCVQQV